MNKGKDNEAIFLFGFFVNIAPEKEANMELNI